MAAARGESSGARPSILTISGVSAEQNARVFAGYADNSTNSMFNGGTHLHLNPERPETPPNPLSTVPFPHDADFVSRDTLLTRIHEKCAVPGTRIALVGVGGVGKSKLAMEYGHWARRQWPAMWVFWVHASNASRFEISFSELAERLRIPGRKEPGANVFQLVENWLQNGKNGNWLLILDNVDDDEFLRKHPTVGSGQEGKNLRKPLLEYLPRSSHGSIIITSRRKDVALNIVSRHDIVEVGPLDASEAVQLLQNKLELPNNGPETLELVTELEFMPLAIIQAASYINRHSRRFSLSRYLEKLRLSDHKAIKLLQRKACSLDRDWEAKNSILVTWQLSFDHIRRQRPSAAKLLSLMSFFDRQGIPEDLLWIPNQEDTDSYSESETDQEFEDDVAILRDYSFIAVAEDGKSFTMHRLVQLTARAWLKTHGKLEQWKAQYIRNLSEGFPDAIVFENWGKCRSLFPHVRSAMQQKPEAGKPEVLFEWARLLCRGALYAGERGYIAEATEMALKSAEQYEALCGANDDTALLMRTILANAYQREGQWEKAREAHLQLIARHQANLGEDNPAMLGCMRRFASTLRQQGRWKEAESLQRQVIQRLGESCGENHPETLESMAELAMTLVELEKLQEAVTLQVDVVLGLSASLGKAHPDTLKKAGELAATMGEAGHWAKAEKLLLAVIRPEKRMFGENHPSTLLHMSLLAFTILKQGRWSESEELYQRVIETREVILGRYHPDTLVAISTLARALGDQGRWVEAERLLANVLEKHNMKLGADHHDTLMSMAAVAFAWKELGRRTDAIVMLRDCLDKQRRALGPDHPDFVECMKALQRWESEEQDLKRGGH